jgi:sec-independent protein translocase protein TatC
MADVPTREALDKVGESNPPDDVPMTVLEHLGELRSRLIKSLLGMIPGMMVAWEYRQNLLEFLLVPYTAAWHKLGLGKAIMNFSSPPEVLVVHMKIAVVCGLMFTSPWVFYQIWAFISPGLYKRERYYAVPFVLASTVFFVGGAFFAYRLMMPNMYEVLLGMGGELPGGSLVIQPMQMITDNIAFATNMLLAFGVVFEVPVVVTFLALAGIVNWRQLLSFGRWWAVIASVLAALLTPTADAFTMLMMLGPLLVLYYFAVVLAYLFGPKPSRDQEAQGEAGAS